MTTLLTMKGFNKQIPADALYFEANNAGSTVQLTHYGTPTGVYLETSTDYLTWTDYTIGDTITLSNIGDKVYFRNKSDIQTTFSKNDGTGRYNFVMSGSIAAKGDIGYLLCKNSTNDLTDSGQYCFGGLFDSCTSLTTSPKLPATTLTFACYYQMFYNCSNLEALPELSTLSLPSNCYANMFQGCSKIKLSTTQTGEYQTPYRIPTEGTGTDSTGYGLYYMFASTGGTFTGTPTINTTYYTSNQVI